VLPSSAGRPGGPPVDSRDQRAMKISPFLAVGMLALAGSLISPLWAQTAASADAGELKEIPICNLLERLDKFAGKRVAVRGIYRFSTELNGLYSEGCPKPLILDGVQRAQALSTEFATEALRQRPEWVHLGEAIGAVMKSGRRQVICVTFTGTLITRNPNLHRLGRGKGERMFGHLGVYPAQLDVDGIQNITVDKNAREPSNMDLR